MRDSQARLCPFRAMMIGHAGVYTIHADSPREAIRRLTTVSGADAGVGRQKQFNLYKSHRSARSDPHPQ
ncbi:MAG: ATPase, T2SS/T4P/T4SS family [Anaerolineales bacterium]